VIVVMSAGASQRQVEGVVERLHDLGLRENISAGEEVTIVGVIGHIIREYEEMLSRLPGVAEVVRVTKNYKLASREFQPVSTVVEVGDVRIGEGRCVVMAGQCSVDSEEMALATAHAVKAAGAHILRGGAYKPRTSPYAFRGLGSEGLHILARARQETGLPVVTEVLNQQDVEEVAGLADMLQIGARNMQNYALLEEVARSGKPILLKRGMSAQVEEWLLAAEYILNEGNRQVVLCERGIRTFETATRFTLDVNAIALARELSHLPVIGDPSHGTGRWGLVAPVARAIVAAGADGLIVEVHPSPDHALSDGAQSLTFENFAKLMASLRRVAEAVDRPLAEALSRAQ
jgi:3-deoxy-7-phosphoheptulonate synthase